MVWSMVLWHETAWSKKEYFCNLSCLGVAVSRLVPVWACLCCFAQSHRGGWWSGYVSHHHTQKSKLTTANPRNALHDRQHTSDIIKYNSTLTHTDITFHFDSVQYRCVFTIISAESQTHGRGSNWIISHSLWMRNHYAVWMQCFAVPLLSVTKVEKCLPLAILVWAR